MINDDSSCKDGFPMLVNSEIGSCTINEPSEFTVVVDMVYACVCVKGMTLYVYSTGYADKKSRTTDS